MLKSIIIQLLLCKNGRRR